MMIIESIMDFVFRHRRLCGLPLFILSILLFVTYVMRYQYIFKTLFLGSEVRSASHATIVENVNSWALSLGPQRHLLRVNEYGRILVYIKNNKAMAVISNGNGWTTYSSSILEERVELIGAVLERNTLYLVAESQGKILYRQIEINMADKEILTTGWMFGPTVTLDVSGMARRPSIAVIDKLPLVSWTLKTERFFPIKTAIRIMAAKADPASFGNWCNLAGTVCGQAAKGYMSGAASEIYSISSRRMLTSILTENDSGKVGVWFVDQNDLKLKRIFLTKSQEWWTMGDISIVASVGKETVEGTSFSAYADKKNNRVFLVIRDSEGKVTVLSDSAQDGIKDVSWEGERMGRNGVITVADDKIMVFYNLKEKLISRTFVDGKHWEKEQVLSSAFDESYLLSTETGEVTGDVRVTFLYPGITGLPSIGVVSLMPAVEATPTITATTIPTPEVTPETLPTAEPTIVETPTPTEITPTVATPSPTIKKTKPKEEVPTPTILLPATTATPPATISPSL